VEEMAPVTHQLARVAGDQIVADAGIDVAAHFPEDLVHRLDAEALDDEVDRRVGGAVEIEMDVAVLLIAHRAVLACHAHTLPQRTSPPTQVALTASVAGSSTAKSARLPRAR